MQYSRAPPASSSARRRARTLLGDRKRSPATSTTVLRRGADCITSASRSRWKRRMPSMRARRSSSGSSCPAEGEVGSLELAHLRSREARVAATARGATARRARARRVRLSRRTPPAARRRPCRPRSCRRRRGSRPLRAEGDGTALDAAAGPTRDVDPACASSTTTKGSPHRHSAPRPALGVAIGTSSRPSSSSSSRAVRARRARDRARARGDHGVVGVRRRQPRTSRASRTRSWHSSWKRTPRRRSETLHAELGGRRALIESRAALRRLALRRKRHGRMAATSLFEAYFRSLYPPDQRDESRAITAPVRPTRTPAQPALLAELDEVAALFARLAPEAFGRGDLALDFSDASVHRLGAFRRSHRARPRSSHGAPPGDCAPIVQVVVHARSTSAGASSNDMRTWACAGRLESVVAAPIARGGGGPHAVPLVVEVVADDEIDKAGLVARYRSTRSSGRRRARAPPAIVTERLDRALPR